ncbi:hypothetical protein PSN45_001890 [Yamadazyma tenuis]|uniref:GATA-type domain-containing protein n=1 Tax=Candida tenuis (strain ATCC 10573 / BCRC 21748 / CBS 615 / JCM 9827 / NBRC 10315 / NRRL Y-1498 / VKM Y-70) TaxID=590646 RepID=G3BDP7_CANTC|nr:uncharacterized protein CANTEDRAFT_136835 [Yamadazyma tenuis ATCC 10573]EGV60352.1 hypothetical protein CANTEDRAFT_136835 [Yamadazyma tenuis ATCC 10573]WEJ94406.1 hypothetical protein PSN45_001890 [Yamadazyma tenuis]
MLDSRTKLPSISELTRSHEVKLPDLSGYTASQPSLATPIKLPSLSQLTHYSPAYTSANGNTATTTNTTTPALQPAYKFGTNYQYGKSPRQMVSPQQMVSPPPVVTPPAAHGQHIHSPTEFPVAQQSGYSYYMPYYSVYYGQSTPSPQQQYLVPEVINKPINKCHRCGTTETPEWRRGPNGVRTLCNACGLYHAKLVKRKGAAIAAQEVLNNKVRKGKNGRRVSIKSAMINSKLM